MEALGQLGVDFRILGTQIAGFLILFFLLYKFGWPHLITVIRAREEEVKGTYEKADKARRDTEAMRDEYESRLQQVEEEIDRKLRNAIKEAEQSSEEILTSARDEAAKAKERALNEIDMERKKALAELRIQAVDLAVLVASKLIEKSVDEATARSLVDKFSSDLDTVQ